MALTNVLFSPKRLRTGKWGWGDHLHVLEAAAVRASLSGFASFVEGLVLQPWWSSKYFDEAAVGRAASRCLVGRGEGGEAQAALRLFDAFLSRRNPELRVHRCVQSAAVGPQVAIYICI